MINERRRSGLSDAALIACAALAVVVGIAFRFADLGAPLFWQDEAYTALRTTGHSEARYERVFDGGVHDVSEIRRFVTLDPERGVTSVVGALAREDPHHAPLFYALERLWIGAFGSSPAAFRSLSAALGTLGIALAFALGTALTGSRLAGSVAASLFALSPLFVLYARQAREYALFADVTLAATVLLVRALQAPSRGLWVAYAIGVAIGFYTDPLFALVALSHGIAVLWGAAPRRSRVRSWAFATAGGAVAFAPWALNAARSRANISTQLDWGATAYPPAFVLQKWAFNLGALGFDAEFRRLALAPVALLVAIALGVAVVAVLRRADGARRIIVPLAATTALAFIVRDVITGAHFSTIPRYLTATWIGLELALAVALSDGLAAPRVRNLACVAWLALLGSGVVSGLVRDGAENWWDNNDQIAFQAIAREIDRADRPLVLTEAHWHVPLVIARYLRDDAQFVLFRNVVPALEPGRRMFLIAPTPAVLRAVAGRFALVNLSPSPATAIAGFHRNLRAANPATFRGDAPAFVAENALWELRPR